MHVRIAKLLMKTDAFDEDEASTRSDNEWAEDIARYSGTSHLAVWLDEIRSKFCEAAAEAVALHGFSGLFSRYDTNGATGAWFQHVQCASRRI